VNADCYVRDKPKAQIMAYPPAAAVFRIVPLSFGPILTLCLMLSGCVSGPPVQEMSNARQAIKAAVDAGAGKGSAAQELTEAKRLLERAEVRFEGQAYREARVSAVAAHGKAKRALSIAQANTTTPASNQPTR
jgi:outer membrane murein-binding lipoprotein Lpp